MICEEERLSHAFVHCKYWPHGKKCMYKVVKGFIYFKKSETMPKPKFKMEKLCHGIYSKFGQYYRYYITMYDFDHIIQFSTPYLELDFQMDVGKCDFFHCFFEMWLSLDSYLNLL